MTCRRCTLFVTTLVLAASASVGCADATSRANTNETSSNNSEDSAKGDRKIVSRGKADNYWSNVSKEYELTGTIPVSMTHREFRTPNVRQRKVARRTTAVGLYLTAYLADKLEEGFDNSEYGGFQSMVRNQSVERENITRAGRGTYRVQFTIDVAGPPNLLQRLLRNGARNTARGVRFSMQMPRGATSDPESVDAGAFRRFDPSEVPPSQLESVTFRAAPLPHHADAYPHYESFASDGLYDITVFFGHDYNAERWDIRTAREVYRTLLRHGFGAPVASFEQLTARSGPFTKTVRAPGLPGTRRVRMEVRLFHAAMFRGARGQHKQYAIRELRRRDVFYYWGHAGPYHGFSFGPNSRADLSYTEIEDLQLSNKRQLVIASGCQTYSQYADMLYANPAKNERNLDVITAVNYTNLVAGDAILTGLVRTKNGVHRPRSFYDLVRRINSPRPTRTLSTFYGVIGIDGNPQVHPYGNLRTIGRSCRSNADCGAHSNANLCVRGRCAVRALSAEACPSGARFGYVGRGTRMESGVCY